MAFLPRRAGSTQIAALVALLLAAALLLPGLARADNTADEADLAFALGNEEYGRRRYEAALRAYFLSYRLVPNRNVLFNIARCFEALGRFDEAYRYYHELYEQPLPEADKEEVEQSLRRILPRVALVRLEPTPSGTEVFVGREDLGSRGRTPLTLALPPGRHRLLLRHLGYRPTWQEVELVRGREVTVRPDLVLITGKVGFTGGPAGAWIRERPEGKDLGRVPTTLELPPGRRLFFLGAPGHLTEQRLVDVAADRSARIRVDLRPLPPAVGKVVVTANRVGATVRVGGVEAGFTPAVLSLPVGEHQVEVTGPELTVHAERVWVEEGGEHRLHADLRYASPPVSAASKSLSSVDEAPASTTVISREEIQAFGWRTLSEALAGVRGVHLSDDRIYTYVGVRGFSPPGDLNTRVLILWDGHPLNDVWAGQGYVAHDLAVDLEELERIEIVRGPGSALYGTGAFFAVVNLVPRSSLGSRNVEVMGAVGGLGAFRGRVTGAHPAERANVLVSGAAFGARGAELTDLGDGGTVRGLDAERAYEVSARARHGAFTLLVQGVSRTKDIPTAPFGTAVGERGTQTLDQRAFAELRYERALSIGELSVRGYYDASRYAGSWVSSEGQALAVARDAGRADWVGAEVRQRFRLLASNQLTVGVEAQAQLRVQQEAFAAEPVPLQTRQRTLLSAYLMDEWRLAPWLLLTAGVRVDRYLDLSATPITPRLALVAHPYRGGLTKLVVGQAFRAPNVYELYYEDGRTQRPALDLIPERIVTLEAEHSHDLTPELRLTLAGYHNRISRLIVLEQEALEVPACEGGEQCLVYRNDPGTVQAWGAEAELRWQAGRHTLVDATYSFVHLVGASGELAAGAPVHLASARLLVPLADPLVRLSTRVRYQGLRRGPRVPDGAGEALLWEVGLSGEQSGFRYFAGVQNLLDARYALPVGSEFDAPVVPQYGRTFQLQLAASF